MYFEQSSERFFDAQVFATIVQVCHVFAAFLHDKVVI
jgi:hypothetical protein